MKIIKVPTDLVPVFKQFQDHATKEVTVSVDQWNQAYWFFRLKIVTGVGACLLLTDFGKELMSNDLFDLSSL
jgi:hypothetical protein